MKFGLKVLMWVLVISAVLTVFRFVMFPLFIADKAIDGAQGVVSKTLDADNMLQNYEWFKQEYQDFLALKNKITASSQSVDNFLVSLPKDRKEWTSDDKAELIRRQTIHDGLEYQLADLISHYNAKSQMYNRTLFKTKDLPYQLEN